MSCKMASRPFNVVHLTSVHPRYDTRIFLKECRSLAALADVNVSLVVADGNGEEVREGVSIYDVGKPVSRISRIRKTGRAVLRQAVALEADLYHFHDPELLLVGLKLKKLGKKVIFDAHEDVAKQLLSKPYLSPLMRRLLSAGFWVYERWACRYFDAVVTATPAIRDMYQAKIPELHVVDINNYPISDELFLDSIAWKMRRNEACYVGAISRIRGIFEVVAAFGSIENCRLNLVGTFNDSRLETELRKLPGWRNVKLWGQLDREGVKTVLSGSKMGIVTFLPSPNHMDAQPNKMFEYMSAGIPVIASNYPLWKDIIEGNDCGICVDPTDFNAIGSAVTFLLEHPERARNMGANGRMAVEGRYNWTIEKQKLTALYYELLKP